ncbi:MAG: pantoate--beta-alanine ligase [Chloroflexi bacterium]|nr:pantoate--beta-alanine ligase [Chloroflexota bacterium]
MRVVTTVAEVWAARRALIGRLGLAPTMGALHAGHLSLVTRARAEADVVWVTVFVNPLQFGPREDLASYPRDLDGDLAKLRAAGVDLVFTPAAHDMYPAGFSTRVAVSGVSEGLEGERRPGHFAGVATVVTKLFALTRPDVAVFGEKDAQQLRVIRRLTTDLGFDLRIIGAPTVREPDGLALSSRNAYLSPAERRAAPVLRQALAAAERAYAAGERAGARLRAAMQAVLAAEPLARVDYVSIADDETLAELDTVTGPALASLAVWLGPTRLIDNVRLAGE